ncbi:IS200/IS605 family transposase [Christiangramia forsetii]|uniref:IS200-like transposase n=2 Tax=Christiangramia forsetii TaxID=411153 RepID=A0M0J7_CHRFK|nr:IS200/IS605 family transposase [Christiangramia forsetii]GGG40735.1 IS200/IS605 family transposase [Christiangramia forsetii]CAL66142.1 IS200-like transposase [Christiangramia forsetii KT0803]
MTEQRSNGHTVSRLTVHVVWCTKYRYRVLKDDIQIRCRSLLIQICEAEDVSILKGVVSKDHVHMHLEYRPSSNVSGLVKKLKGRSSRKLQQEFPELKKRYWGRHFWAVGYGCWSTGNITDEMVDEYLEHHRKPDDRDNSDFIIEK